MEAFGNLLKGKKTLIAALAVCVITALQMSGYITTEQSVSLMGLLTSFGLVAARAATTAATGQ